METAMRNVSINDRTTPTMSPIIKTESSTQQEQPLDFSTKVRVCTIDDDSVRKISADSAIDCSNDNSISRPESPCNLPTPTREPATGHHLPTEENRQNLIGQPRVSMPMPMPNINSFLPQNTMTAAAGMGMFYPGSPMFPNLMPPGFNGSMWPNPMAAMMQQQQEAARKLIGQTATANKQSSLSMDNFNKQFMGKIGIPGAGRVFPNMPGFPGAGIGGGNISNIPDPNILAEALKSHEEMFNAYKQQVLSQKATDEAKRGPRRHQPAATATAANGHSSSTPQANGSHITPESNTLSQIIENQSDVADENGTGTKAHSDNSSEIDVSKETSSSSSSSSTSDEDKHSGAGSTGDLSQTAHSNHDPAQPTHSTMAAFPGQLLPGEERIAPGALGLTGGIVGGVLLPPATNGQVLQGSTGTSLHSSDESIGTRNTDSSGRRSTTPAHSSTSEVHDLNGMRPRSMTLPTQSDSRTLSYSPSPSVLSTGNASSGPGTPNSKASGSFRKRARTLPDDQKVKRHRDEAYWERRRKNNEAAKRSRDSRRAKEDEIAIRAAFLEQENIRLRIELASLKTQTAKLRSELIIFQGPDDPPHRGHPHPADGS